MKSLSLSLIASLAALLTACEHANKRDMAIPKSAIYKANFVLTDSVYGFSGHAQVPPATTKTKINELIQLTIDSATGKAWYNRDTMLKEDSSFTVFSTSSSVYSSFISHQQIKLAGDSIYITKMIWRASYSDNYNFSGYKIP